MAYKRKAQEAFDRSNGQLSAFAAARLAKQSKHPEHEREHPIELEQVQRIVLDVREAAHDIYRQEHCSPPERLSAEDGATALPKPRMTTLSNFLPNHIRHKDDDCLEITLHNGQYVTALGELDVEVSQGIATVYGATFHKGSSAHRLYAPSTHALPQILARQNNSVVRLTSTKSTIRKLEKLSPLFRNIWAEDAAHTRSFALLATSDDHSLKRFLFPLEIDLDVQKVLGGLVGKLQATPHRSRVMTVGGKSSGKSTFNRILCNMLVSEPSQSACLYLDLDPGQPEFGPPGQVALVKVVVPVLGPPFAHMASQSSKDYQLLRSHTIAATSFKDDPEYYLECVKDLCQHADDQHPLLVNSCGWVTGLGAEVLISVMDIVSITAIVLMDPIETELANVLQNSSSKPEMHHVPRRLSRPTSRTPAELRSMQTMAYFHCRAAYHARQQMWIMTPISRLRPWSVSYDGINSGIAAVISYSHYLNPNFLIEALDGSIVALVTTEINPASQISNKPLLTNISRTPEGIPYSQPSSDGFCRPVNPESSECAGLALIRGVDVQRKQLHLVTPLSEKDIAALMDKALFLVRGSFDTPGWAYVEDLYVASENEWVEPEEGRKPWVSKKDLVGVEGAVWRLRYPPIASAVVQNG